MLSQAKKNLSQKTSQRTSKKSISNMFDYSNRGDTSSGSSFFVSETCDYYNSWEHSIYNNIIYYGFLKNKGMKSFAQNFLCDENLLDKIAHSAMPLDQNTTIVEIGAGPCGLTRSIIKNFPRNKLVCIEKDVRFKTLHNNMIKYTKHDLTFEYADALKYDLKYERVAIISNLPYNVGTVLLIKWLTSNIDLIDKMVLLFQKEVAERICAKIGSKHYGSVSVLSQLLCDTSLLFDISNKAFIPSPKITSSLVLFLPKKDNRIDNINLETFARFVNKCFQFRRKIIYSTLKRLCPLVDVELLLSQQAISKNQRPETITPEQYLQLFKNMPNDTSLYTKINLR